MLDYLLCRPPIAVIYLAAAVSLSMFRIDHVNSYHIQVILSRKLDIERLLQDDEYDDDTGMGMAHSLLNALLKISDDVPEIEGSLKEVCVSGPVNVESLDTIDAQGMDTGETVKQEDGIPNGIIPVKHDNGLAQLNTDKQPTEPDLPAFLAAPAISMVESRPSPSEEDAEIDISIVSKAEDPLRPSSPEESKNVPTSSTCSTHPCSPFPPQSPPGLPERKPLRPPTPPHRSTSTHALMTLSSLLTHANTLYELYPPTHPGLAMSSIMGPQSVVYTWREPSPPSFMAEAESMEWEEQRIADDEAEAMVA